MTTAARAPLEAYLARDYPFQVVAEAEGGFTILFPDLPGCMTQAETLDEVAPMAVDARNLWIETAHDHGIDIPPPSLLTLTQRTP